MAEALASCTILIARPLSEVFAFMVDYRNNSQWQEGLLSVEQVDHPPTVGARITTTRKVMGRTSSSTIRVTEFTPNARIRSRSESGPVDYTGGYDFEAAGEATTRLIYQGKITTGRMMGPVGRLLAKGFQKQMDGNLGRLKTVLERG